MRVENFLQEKNSPQPLSYNLPHTTTTSDITTISKNAIKYSKNWQHFIFILCLKTSKPGNEEF